ncbi:MAG: IPT/TIG domain-containing protein, partial [Actinomycetota bacterium]|nr:IPT/TIG domain-containing protein [Actinomycetota bacterium]
VSSGSDTSVVVAAASGSNVTGDVVVTSNTGSTVTAVNGWSYIVAGTIAAVDPSSGQGGTRVTLTGTNLLGGDSSLATVALDGVEATVSSESDETVVVVAGNSSAGDDVDVVITASSGAVITSAGSWSYLEPGAVDSVQPSTGVEGTRVTIRGERLRGGGGSVDSVSLAGAEAEVVTAENDTVVEIVAGAAGEGSGDVVLVADTGATVTSVDGWAYLAPSTVDTVEPAVGQFDTRVTISGDGLFADGDSLASVTLVGVEVQEVSSASDTEVVVVAGRADAASGDTVLVANTGGRVTAADSFEYRTEGEILAVSPSSGHGGTEVNIYGSSLLAHGSSVAGVTLAGAAAEVKEGTDLFVTVIAAAADEG